MTSYTFPAYLPVAGEAQAVRVTVELAVGELEVVSVRRDDGGELLPGLPLADRGHLQGLAEAYRPEIEAAAQADIDEQAAELRQLFARG